MRLDTQQGKSRTAPDEVLIGAFAREGDESAFAALAKRYTGLIRSTAGRELPPDMVNDAVQDVLLLLSKQAGRLVRPGALPAWLIVVTRRTCWKIRRRHRHRSHAWLPDVVDDGSPSASAEADEAARHLHRAIACLAPKQRGALVLHYYCGLTQREVAERLGCSEDAVQKRISYAIGKLRKAMAGHDPKLAAGAVASVFGPAWARATELAEAAVARPAASAGVASIVIGGAAMKWAAGVLVVALLAGATILLGPWAPPPANQSAPSTAATVPSPQPMQPVAAQPGDWSVSGNATSIREQLTGPLGTLAVALPQEGSARADAVFQPLLDLRGGTATLRLTFDADPSNPLAIVLQAAPIPPTANRDRIQLVYDDTGYIAYQESPAFLRRRLIAYHLRQEPGTNGGITSRTLTDAFPVLSAGEHHLELTIERHRITMSADGRSIGRFENPLVDPTTVRLGFSVRRVEPAAQETAPVSIRDIQIVASPGVLRRATP